MASLDRIRSASFVLLFAIPVLAQTMPDCVIEDSGFLNIPARSAKAHVEWQLPLTMPVQGNAYFPGGFLVEYGYSESPSFLASFTLANGGSLGTFSSMPSLNPYHYLCNYLTNVGCNVPSGLVPPTYDEGSQDIDISGFTAGGDVTLAVTAILREGQHTVTVRDEHSGAILSEGVDCNTFSLPRVSVTIIPPPHFEFARIAEPAKMIAHLTATWDVDSYTSREQRRSTDSFPGVALGNRPQFFVRGDTRTLTLGTRVWFRVIDPPDTAPYAASVAATSDNLDSAGGMLYTADGRSAQLGTAIDVVADATGDLTMVLEGSDHEAGDNYQVLSSLDPPGPNGKLPCEATNTCSSTPVITIWKRLYYEQAKMVKAGAFLAQDVAGGTTSCTPTDPCEIHVRSIAISGMNVIAPGASLTLMGAGRAGLNSVDGPHFETVTIDQDSASLGNAVTMISPMDFAVRLTSRPSHSYVGGPGLRAMYDAVAVNSSGGSPDTWSLDPSGVAQVLTDAFIEYSPTPTSGILPYVGILTSRDYVFLRRWFLNAERYPAPYAPFENHRELIAADRDQVVIGTTQQCETDLGLRVNPGRYSYIFSGSITRGAAGPLNTFYPSSVTIGEEPEVLPPQCAGLALTGVFNRNPDQIAIGVAAHEAVHQFSVNAVPADARHDGRGHCIYPHDFTGQHTCLMDHRYPASASNAQISGLILNMHFDGNGADSEYATMRRELDPLR
ncbi:MAG: hypothetical protein JOZ54_12625 [Acidobacteria bacterium]|nr:hypothetical protein [Acidobacteriota bacterium]